MSMTAEIISVGTELLLGNILNTNAQYLSRELAALGITVRRQSTIGDNQDRLADFVNEAKQRCDLLVFTGGLGPTADDLTKETVAACFGDTLTFDPEEWQKIVDFFTRTGRETTPNNRKQAMVPVHGHKVVNHHGTAPGAWFEQDGRCAVLMPGVPHEMKAMWEESVRPLLLARQSYALHSLTLRVLGGESDMLDSMSTGMLDMGIITSGPFVNFSEMMGVLDMPYLFANNEEAYKVLDGEIGRELLDTLEDAGLKGLAYAERGFRNVTNSVRPVTCADDLAGLKLRVMENEVYTATFKALKVNAVPMAWAEALTAMQQGTIEGEENPINVIYSYSLWDYGQKYVTLDRHSYSTAIITMSLDVFNSLDEATQAIFLQSAQEAAEYERAWVAEQEADQLATIKSHGVEVVENPDVDSLRAAVQSVYDAYPQYADYIARIQALLAE